MKTKCMQLGRWAATVLLCSLVLSPSARSQESCPESWYDAVPPNPDWGLPPTVGGMFPCNFNDTHEAEAFFLVPLAGLQSLLPPGVTALKADSDKAFWGYLDYYFDPDYVSRFGLVAVVFFEHNSVQYGEPYKQAFAMAMVDDPAWPGTSVWYGIGTGVITSEAAQWWGAAAFGWPWALGDTHFQYIKPQGIKAFASVDDELVMEMEMSTEDMTLLPYAEPPFIMQYTKEGYLTRASFTTPAETATAIRHISGNLGMCTLRFGPHPIAQQLQAIGLGQYPSVMRIWNEHIRATVDRGTCTPLP